MREDLLVITATHVERESSVDLLGVRQVESIHDSQELLLGLGEAQVELLLLTDGALSAAFVVMGWEHRAAVRQSEQLGVDIVVEAPGVSCLEVGSPAASNEQGVAREHH